MHKLSYLVKRKIFNYDGCRALLETAMYTNDSLAVIMFREDGELYGDVTVNLDHPMQSPRMAILDETICLVSASGSKRTGWGLTQESGLAQVSVFILFINLIHCKRKALVRI